MGRQLRKPDHPVARRMHDALHVTANPTKVPEMTRYMRNRQPFLGVAAPAVKRIAVEEARAWRPSSAAEAAIPLRQLWEGVYREERYGAIRLADAWRLWQFPESLALCRWMIHTGAWWDLTDPITTRWVSPLALAHPPSRTEAFGWIGSPDLWLRRAAVLAQFKFKHDTDRAALTMVLNAAATDEDFFIRKAVGWALREFAKSDPEWVRSFVSEAGGRLSPLSRREAMKQR